MSPVIPTTVAATTGPTPKISAVLVPDAAASATRAASTAVWGSTEPSNCTAFET